MEEISRFGTRNGFTDLLQTSKTEELILRTAFWTASTGPKLQISSNMQKGGESGAWRILDKGYKEVLFGVVGVSSSTTRCR